MTLEAAKSTFLLKHCAERCKVYQADDTCKNCEINVAIKAIEKQIPKKAKLHRTFEALDMTDSIYLCPSCGVMLDTENYCTNCGQAIDWEVENKWI